ICQRSSALNSALPLSAPPAPGRLGPASLLGGVPCLAGARLWLPSHVLAKRLVVLPCQAAVRELAQVVLDPLAEHPVLGTGILRPLELERVVDAREGVALLHVFPDPLYARGRCLGTDVAEHDAVDAFGVHR